MISVEYSSSTSQCLEVPFTAHYSLHYLPTYIEVLIYLQGSLTDWFTHSVTHRNELWGTSWCLFCILSHPRVVESVSLDLFGWFYCFWDIKPLICNNISNGNLQTIKKGLECKSRHRIWGCPIQTVSIYGYYNVQLQAYVQQYSSAIHISSEEFRWHESICYKNSTNVASPANKIYPAPD